MGAPSKKNKATQEKPPWRDAPVIARGRLFGDFKEGDRFTHHWGRTILPSDALLFATMTMQMNPLYVNRPFALSEGHRDIPVHPLLVFNVILGLSVEDLSEAESVFLGVDSLTYHAPVYPGDTLSAKSKTLQARASKGRPDYGIVRWHTEGFNQEGVLVIDYERANLIPKKRTAS